MHFRLPVPAASPPQPAHRFLLRADSCVTLRSRHCSFSLSCCSLKRLSSVTMPAVLRYRPIGMHTYLNQLIGPMRSGPLEASGSAYAQALRSLAALRFRFLHTVNIPPSLHDNHRSVSSTDRQLEDLGRLPGRQSACAESSRRASQRSQRLGQNGIVRQVADPRRDRLYCARALLDILDEPAKLTQSQASAPRKHSVDILPSLK
jgi:hypothetical protein